jgi:protocatechuate 3,4-dioxygenase beta subunit
MRWMIAVVFLFVSGAFPVRAEEWVCRGRVVDDHGDPVAGARVTLHDTEWGSSSTVFRVRLKHEVTSGESGEFVFPPLAGPPSHITGAMAVASKEGHAIGWYWFHERRRQAREIRIVLGPPFEMKGVVKDLEGRPVAGAALQGFFMVEGGRESNTLFGIDSLDLWEARSDGEGRFRFSGLPAGTVAILHATAAGYAGHHPEHTIGWRDNTLHFKVGEDATITLQPESVLEGGVVDADGSPVGGVRLMLNRTGQVFSPFGVQYVLTDAQGRFRVGGLGEGDWTVRPEQAESGGPEVLVGTTQVHLGFQETLKDVKVVIERGEGLLITVLDDESGEPVPGAVVLSINDKTNVFHMGGTGGQGTIRLPVSGTGNLNIQVQKEGFDPFHLGGRSGEEVSSPMTVRLERSLIIHGVVLDPEGEPLADAEVGAFPVDFFGAVTDVDGSFELSWFNIFGDRDQEVAILVRHEGCRLGALVKVQDPQEEQVIRLPGAVTVKGVVSYESGRPAAGARVRVNMCYGDPHSISTELETTITDEQGGFEVACCPRGCELTLRVYMDGYGCPDEEISLDDRTPDVVEKVGLVLIAADASVSGIVVGDNGDPVEGATIQTIGEGQPEVTVTTNAKGEFNLKGVCPGKVRVFISPPEDDENGRGMGTVKDLTAGETDVRIDLAERYSVSPIFEVDRPPEPKSLLGKPLPDLEALALPAAGEFEGRMLVLCFFDFEQRPSRHFAKKLAELAERLAGVDRVILGVETSDWDRKEIRDWLGNCGLSIPVGAIKADRDEVLARFGVKSLPWILLADGRHVVRFEDVELKEIEKNLKDLN